MILFLVWMVLGGVCLFISGGKFRLTGALHISSMPASPGCEVGGILFVCACCIACIFE